MPRAGSFPYISRPLPFAPWGKRYCPCLDKWGNWHLSLVNGVAGTGTPCCPLDPKPTLFKYQLPKFCAAFPGCIGFLGSSVWCKDQINAYVISSSLSLWPVLKFLQVNRVEGIKSLWLIIIEFRLEGKNCGIQAVEIKITIFESSLLSNTLNTSSLPGSELEEWGKGALDIFTAPPQPVL